MITTTITIESLDQEGRGVGRAEGKTVFVEGALPDERVQIETLKRKPTYDVARVATIERANASRVTPRCPHFGVCGGGAPAAPPPPPPPPAQERTAGGARPKNWGGAAATRAPPGSGPR